MALVKHSELSVQQIAEIQKDVLVNLRNETFWDKFCSHTKVEAGVDALEWRKLNLPDLTAADVKNLEEGVTPPSLKMTYVKFRVTPEDYGNWIEYTDKSKRYNYDDVVRDAKTVLSSDAHQQAEWRKGIQFISGTCTMDAKPTFMKTLLATRTVLRKNKIKPLKGNKFGCILTAEKAAEVLETYANQITHTSQHEALINGYLGELGGFILFENTDPFMYKNDTTTYGLFFGKGAYGLPVQTVAFGNSSVEVYDNGLGSVPQKVGEEVRPDALHQRGSVAYKVMGFAARIVEDESIIRVELPIEGKEESTVVDSTRKHYVASSTSGQATA